MSLNKFDTGVEPYDILDCRWCDTVDALPWVQLMADRLKHWRTHDVELSRAAALTTVFVEVP